MTEISMPVAQTTPENQTAHKEIPTASGLPFLGNTMDLMNAPLDFLVDQYYKLGPVFKVKTFNQEMILMAGLEANQFLSRNANNCLITKEFWGAFSKIMDAELSLVSEDGEEHMKLRRVMMRGYSPKMITKRFPKVVEITKKMIIKNAVSKKHVPVVTFIQRLITEQLGILLANRAPEEYYKHLSFYIRTVLNVAVVKMWPQIALKNPKFLKAKRKVKEFGNIIIADHRAVKHTDQPDLIDDMLQAVDEEKIKFTYPELMLAVLGPFFAGMDTVTNTCASMIYALAKNPDIMAKMQAEADAIFAEGSPDLHAIKKMHVTHAVVLETLRRYPVAPMIPRTAGKDFEFAGYTIKKGSVVYMGQGVTHFLPELFPNPYKFDIERYSPPRNEHRKKGAFSPYGLGAHKCLGNRLGEVQMMLTMATLLHMVDIELVPKDYELKLQAVPTVGPEFNFKVKFNLRHMH